jgi:lipid II:glycine glycyltransferase (peptidoglycan interpeptide bridge formation enzyme)
MSHTMQVDNFTNAEWENSAKEFDDYNIYQTWSYQQVRGEMDNQKISRFILKAQDNHVITMGQVRIRHVKSMGLKIGYIQWGPLVRRGNDVTEWPVDALKLVREYYLSNKVNVLRIVPDVYINETCENYEEILACAGFGRVSRIRPYHTMLFPLDIDKEGMRKLFHNKWRASLRKAEKNDMTVSESRDVGLLRKLNEMYQKAQDRKKFRGLNIEEFIHTQERLPVPQKMNMVVIRKAEEILSIDVNSYLGDTCVGLFQATTENGLTQGASYLAWWHTFLAAKRAGMRRYDMGGVDPKANPNVYKYKCRMGADEVFHIGCYDSYADKWTMRRFWAADCIYNAVKKRLW